MWNFICPELLKAIDTEPENEVLSEHMHSFAKVSVNRKMLYIITVSRVNFIISYHLVIQEILACL